MMLFDHRAVPTANRSQRRPLEPAKTGNSSMLLRMNAASCLLGALEVSFFLRRTPNKVFAN